MVDDPGKEWISCYGAQDIQAPNIDAPAVGGESMEPGAGLVGLSVDFSQCAIYCGRGRGVRRRMLLPWCL